jgi:hypothetical protein
VFYGESLLHNDHEMFRLKRASKKAAMAWRFRHCETREVRLLRTLAARLRRMLGKMRPSRTPTIYTTREQVVH